MTAVENLSEEDKEFLRQCEEEFQHRYTDKDEEFMKVYNAETSIPPIIRSWKVPHNSGGRNDRRFNRRHNVHDRPASYNDRSDNRYGRDYHGRGNSRREYNNYNDQDRHYRGGGYRHRPY